MAINYSDHVLQYSTKKTWFLTFMQMPFCTNLTQFISCVHLGNGYGYIHENKVFENFLKGELYFTKKVRQERSIHLVFFT